MRNILLILITSLLLSSCYRDLGEVGRTDINHEVCTSITKKSYIKTAKDLEEKLKAAYQCEALYLTTSLRLEGWTSIDEFKGILEGQDKTITIISFKRDAVGLIKKIEKGAAVKDLNIILENALETYGHSGVLAGENKGRLVNIKVSSKSNDIGIKQIKEQMKEQMKTGLKRQNDYVVGGLIGINGLDGKVERCSSSIKVENSDNSHAGGLIAYNDGGNVIDSYATGDVTGYGNNDIGGFVGRNRGNIENSFATGTVTGPIVGGLVGRNQGSGYIKNSYATGDVKGNYTAGGFVGYSDSAIAIENCYSTGKVAVKVAVDKNSKNSKIQQHIGGFVGYLKLGKIINCYSTGKVAVKVAVDKNSTQHIGGFVGYLELGEIINCYSKAESLPKSPPESTSIYVGRFAGFVWKSSSIKNSFVMEVTPPEKNVARNNHPDLSPDDIKAIKTKSIIGTTFSHAGWSTSVWKNLVDRQWPKLLWQK